MQLHHRKPCNECPWRKTSPAGWLGGYSPEMYADAVAANEIPACHLRDFGPWSDETAFCVGALQTGVNGCILPHRAVGDAISARKEVGGSDEVFGHPALFYEHHAGKPWTPPIMRRLK